MKRAYHDIILSDGILRHGPVVVETDEKGHFLDWHLIQEEEASTEWVGGTYNLSINSPQEKKSI